MKRLVLLLGLCSTLQAKNDSFVPPGLEKKLSANSTESTTVIVTSTTTGITTTSSSTTTTTTTTTTRSKTTTKPHTTTTIAIQPTLVITKVDQPIIKKQTQVSVQENVPPAPEPVAQAPDVPVDQPQPAQEPEPVLQVNDQAIDTPPVTETTTIEVTPIATVLPKVAVIPEVGAANTVETPQSDSSVSATSISLGVFGFLAVLALVGYGFVHVKKNSGTRNIVEFPRAGPEPKRRTISWVGNLSTPVPLPQTQTQAPVPFHLRSTVIEPRAASPPPTLQLKKSEDFRRSFYSSVGWVDSDEEVVENSTLTKSIASAALRKATSETGHYSIQSISTVDYRESRSFASYDFSDEGSYFESNK